MSHKKKKRSQTESLDATGYISVALANAARWFLEVIS